MVSYEQIKDLYELNDLNFLGKYIITFSKIYYKHSDLYENLDEVIRDFQEELTMGLSRADALKKSPYLTSLLKLYNSNYVLYSLYEDSEHIFNPYYFDSKDSFEKIEFYVCKDLEILRELGFNINYKMN